MPPKPAEMERILAFNRGHAEATARDDGGGRDDRPRRSASAFARTSAQFTLLVVVNAFVGAMVGMERSILPAIAEQEFHLAARTAMLSFIVVFGVTRRSPTTSRDGSPIGSGASRCSSRLARRRAGAVHADVGADLDLDSRGERAARHQPGPHVVDDGDHEDRSRRRRRGAAWRWA